MARASQPARLLFILVALAAPAAAQTYTITDLGIASGDEPLKERTQSPASYFLGARC